MNFTSNWTRWPGRGLLRAFPAAVVALVALGGGQAVELELLQDAPHAGGLIVMSWSRLRYIAILAGPKW
jgi:hypothetical protein